MHRRTPLTTVAGSLLAFGLVACGGAPQRYSSQTAAYPTASRAETYASGGAVATAAIESTVAEPPAMPAAAPMALVPGSHPRSAHVPGPAAATTTAATTSANPTHAAETPNGARGSEQAAPMLIYTATVAMSVERPTQTIDQIVEAVSAGGGFLQQRNDAMVQVRVPSARFRELLGALERYGDVTHREVQAEDVSEQFHDLEVQLANLRSVQRRLQEFLTRAANVQEALIVEHELERVGAQIDQIEGRMRFLSARAAFSTITIYLTRRETAVVTPVAVPVNDVSMPFPWLGELGVPRLLQLR
jgi:hypothetical protein